MRGGVVVITAIASVLVLKRKLYSYHICGCCLVIVGILVVGL
jgi:drug/metabolite transporter (DMT)-like permease